MNKSAGITVLVVALIASLFVNSYFALNSRNVGPHIETSTKTSVATTTTSVFFPEVVIESRNSTYSTTETFTSTLTTTIAQGLTAPFVTTISNANVSVDFPVGDMAANPLTGVLYAGDTSGGNYLVEIELVPSEGYTVVNTIPIAGSSTGSIIIDPVTNRIYATLLNSSGSVFSLVEINGNTSTVIASTNSSVSEICVNPVTDTIYAIQNQYNGPPQNLTSSLLAINGSTLKTVANVSLPGLAGNIAVDPESNMVYVETCTSVSLACGNNYVLAVNATDFNITSIAAPSFGLSGLGVNPDTNMIYVLSYGFYQNSTGTVLISINGTTDTIVATTRLSAFNNGAYEILVDPLIDEIFVLSSYSVIPGDGSLTIFDGTNNNILNELFVPYGPTNMASDGENLFIATGSPTGSSNSSSLIILQVRQLAFP